MRRTILLILCLILPAVAGQGVSAAETSADSASQMEMLKWLVGLKDWAAVIDEADALVERGECEVDCHELRALSCLRLSRYEQAEHSFAFCRRARPEDPRIAGYLGLSVKGLAQNSADQGREAEAILLFSRASDLLGEASLAETAGDRLVRSWASALAGAERFQEEISAIRALIARLPEDTAARLRLALLLKEQGELDQARAVLEAAPLLTEDLTTALFNVAVQMFRADRLDDAEAVTSHLLERNPDHAPSSRLRGFVRYRKGDVDAAIADLRRYLDLAPDTPEAEPIRKQLEQVPAS